MKKILLYGIVYRHNVDIFCRALLEDLCQLEGREFEDPGKEYLWMVPREEAGVRPIYSINPRFDIFISQELQDRLQKVGIFPYSDSSGWHHKWGMMKDLKGV